MRTSWVGTPSSSTVWEMFEHMCQVSKRDLWQRCCTLFGVLQKLLSIGQRYRISGVSNLPELGPVLHSLRHSLLDFKLCVGPLPCKF